MKEFVVWAMTMIAPFGSWQSPVSTDLIVSQSIPLVEMQADDQALYWTELHPQEKGRYALMQFDGQSAKPLLEDKSIRTRVHEYGGGAFSVHSQEFTYVSDPEGALYTLSGEKLTDCSDTRFADGDCGIWVAEKHTEKGILNFLAKIENGKAIPIATGHDFYSSPRVSPDGKQLAFITWDFPNMQWDSSTLWLADFNEDGQLQNLKAISGGQNESVCQVQWSKEGILHFVSDKTGFWNLYRLVDGQCENLCSMDAEFAGPAWIFGQPSYTFDDEGTIYCYYVIKGVDHLGRIRPGNAQVEDLKQPYTRIGNVVHFKGKIYFFGASPSQPLSLIEYDIAKATSKIIKQSSEIPVTEDWIPKGEVLEYPTKDGQVGYGFYYPPKNPNFEAPEGEKPPLIVKSHGGPTARSYNAFTLEILYWTSRGFAFVDVNYGGSTGYGREYFKRLEGNWGIVDVDDCISCANVLVEKGLADPKRLLIRGGSAGGYTTLAALAFHDVFAAGTSYYGVSDLSLLYNDGHKFESKYNDMLVGPLEESQGKIHDRSPIHHVDKFKVPVLLLQGEEDKIVPPNQSELIYQALIEKKIPTGYILFPEEGHGFRQSQNIKRALDAELFFYSEVLNIPLPESFEKPPVELVY